MNCFLSELPCRPINISGRINLKRSADLNYIWIIFAIFQFILLEVRTIEKEYLDVRSRFRDNSSKQTDCICIGIEGKQIVVVVDNDRKGSAVLFSIGKDAVDNNKYRSASIGKVDTHIFCIWPDQSYLNWSTAGIVPQKGEGLAVVVYRTFYSWVVE